MSYRGRWIICHFSNIEVHFVVCQIKLNGIFPFLIKYYHILFIIIIFWLGSDRLSGLLSCPLYFSPYSRLSSYRLPLSIVLFQSCCSHARVFGKTLVHEFPIFYSHTEWYFLISLFGAREYKHAQRTLL